MLVRFIVCMALCAGAVGACAVLSADPGAAKAPGEANVKPAELRLREGEQVELVGALELSGDRATFTPADSKVTLRVLENLALERITKILSESRDDRRWQVSGTVTEYRGGNYILIHKAVQRIKK